MEIKREKNPFIGPVLGFLRFLLTLGLVAVFLEILVEVSFRYLLHKPLPWGGEVSRTLLVWITFIGAALALFKGEHMSVNVALDKCKSPKVRKSLRTLGLLMILAFLIIAFRGGIQVVLRSWDMLTTALQIPAGILYLAFPVGCGLMIVATLRELFMTLAVRKE